ncbi:C4-type zinc ribbon domain-containing protein [uncultured Rikenella sp.]|uniref:zinc ribbon domain-containing protein n=1 Tax=uncultured Rikenella sp. TaxID=368003 RepID=UPI0025F0FB7E|nr:C4-type zinc ribbon domain-containing protein [uncultured Rikenella sp.]
MATKTKNVAEELSTEEKIGVLYALQQIDSKMDSINHIKGELPFEVQDLEDVIGGLETRIGTYGEQADELSREVKTKKEEIEQAKALIKKYEAQQDDVRNNREFDSLSKEIEYQKLEIELAEKRIKEFNAEIKNKKKQIEDTKALLEDRKIDLDAKRAELEGIEQETAKELAELGKQAAEARGKIDERLLSAYDRIRKNVRNGLAVVTVKRDACGGCFNRIPPQRQLDIRMSKKIIVCEYCGRILVSDLLDGEQK